MKQPQLTRRFVAKLQGAMLLCTLIVAPSCSIWPGPLPDSIQTEIQGAVDRGFDGVIVCVNQPGKITHYAAGWHNRDTKDSADPGALFKIASISKLYIAVAAAKMVTANQLSLDNSLAEYLPELADRIEHSDEITLRMLLQHRSGIPDFYDQKEFPWGDPPENNMETLELVLDEPAKFSPDRRTRYSNTNYLLIGEILDKTLGYSHHQYIKEEILMPLGLINTYSLLSEVDIADVMSGYAVGYELDIKGNDFIAPGGSMVATAEDVSIFLRALIDGSLLTDEEQEMYSSLYKYEHTGLLPGYQSIARYHEESDAVIIQFVNTSGKSSWSKSETVYRRVVKIVEKVD